MPDYSKAHAAAAAKYADLAKKSLHGDAQARDDKHKAKMEQLNIERQAAKDGQVLIIDDRGNQHIRETASKRSLQEEYVRRFDDSTPVNIDGKTTTLREYHSKRLLGR